jgi:tetratricopeptide (TPR) repeat protein
MMRIHALPLLAFVLVSAASAGSAQKWVRRGNEAFDRGDYTAAVDWYTKAEETVTDPGMVAFNKGAALYRLGRFREAELHYSRCREDASGERLARLLYDLANSIIQQAQDREVPRLEQAIGLYEECLYLESAPADLLENARFNLQLARMLLVRAKAAKDQSPSDRSGSMRSNHSTKEKSHANRRMAADGQPGSPDSRGQIKAPADSSGDPARSPQETSQSPPPGVGNLPVLPDQDDLVSLSPEDTAAYLDEVAARVLRQKQEHKRRATDTAPRAELDW